MVSQVRLRSRNRLEIGWPRATVETDSTMARTDRPLPKPRRSPLSGSIGTPAEKSSALGDRAITVRRNRDLGHALVVISGREGPAMGTNDSD